VACLAAEALGPENVLAVLMPSRFSSEDSVFDAYALAAKLGLKTHEISIEHPFQSYLDLLTPYFEGKPGDVTEENLQARIRGMILMSLSNKHGYIVLSTGNKSELAMGYSTLYGDLCGGLAVIGDVTKGQVYALSKWINREKEVIPWNTITKPPSAELRPNQKDSDSLPDYEIIDTVLQAYLEDYWSVEKIAEHHGYPLELVQSLIQRIHRNEYKRRQAPPCLRVSEKAFFIGRQFPIVQKFMS
jgi:NAD+ synthase (glutamine-hydrolysing)